MRTTANFAAGPGDVGQTMVGLVYEGLGNLLGNARLARTGQNLRAGRTPRS